ncbi:MULTISPECIES: TIR domain-containing protein [Actinomadura]|uniref:TIR domain-containing protein n=2 Tax=Actinomadura yumaensis TaxID=111807 RepID=A0ABW2CLB2_9ACTN|nr:TIR domain-containing protein [Actinomadura sp. J1-007]
MESIFISYRSADDAYAAALLDEMLSQRFGHNNVFRASRSIAPGSDYQTALLAAVGSTKVMLVIVGRSWAAETAPAARHAFSPDDWVRKEVAKAIELGIVVIPILLSGAPRLADLKFPPDMQKFTSFQYMRFDYKNIDNDFRRVEQEVSRYIPRAAELSKDAIASTLRNLASRVEVMRERDENK